MILPGLCLDKFTHYMRMEQENYICLSYVFYLKIKDDPVEYENENICLKHML